MNSDRRIFLQSSLGLATAALLTPSFGAEARQSQSGESLFKQMRWLNEPTSSTLQGAHLIVKSKPKTDFWRKTFYGYITDNGHFYHLPVRGDFVFQARVNGKYAAQYDQAGLMVRLDEQHWMKCGSELVDGKRQASVVFTHDFSDWSTLDDLSQTDAVWWRAVRRKDSIETQCSKDGSKYLTVRQGYFAPEVEVSVGVMCAAPEGGGFEAAFDDVELSVG
jgi:regulation of enolase protein 1 (concanavalin A-like superfamily)